MFCNVVMLLLLLLNRFSHVQLCVTPQTAAHQAPLSLGFSRQEHWSGLPFPFPTHESEKWKWSRSVLSDSSRPHGLHPTRLLHPWDFPGKSTGVGCQCLLRQCSHGHLLFWGAIFIVSSVLKIFSASYLLLTGWDSEAKVGTSLHGHLFLRNQKPFWNPDVHPQAGIPSFPPSYWAHSQAYYIPSGVIMTGSHAHKTLPGLEAADRVC